MFARKIHSAEAVSHQNLNLIGQRELQLDNAEFISELMFFGHEFWALFHNLHFSKICSYF